MPETPLLTVIIPTYNVEKYLRRCLDSVINQTYGNLEIIIIDDNSADSTPQIIKEYADKDSRIKTVFHKENKGPGVSRNEGLRLASGKYVTFVDHDDWQDLTRYEKMVKLAQKTDVDIIFSKAWHYDREGETTYSYWEIPKIFKGKEIADIKNWPEKDLLLQGAFNTPWAKMLKIDFIKRYKIKFSENGNRFDDILYHYLSIINSNTVSFLDETLYIHRYFSESITGRSHKNFDMYFDLFKTWTDLKQYAADFGIDPKIILSRFLHEFAQYLPVVDSGRDYLQRVKEIIKESGLKKEDVPTNFQKSFQAFGVLSSLFLYRRKKYFSLWFRPTGIRLILFGKTIFEKRFIK